MSEGNGYAGRESLLALSVRRYRDVEIDDGLKYRIQSLTEREKSSYEADILSNKSGQSVRLDRIVDSRLQLVVLCLVDGAGKRLFSKEDIPALRELDSAVVNALTTAINEHIAIEPGEVEKLVKNSERVRVESSPTA